MKKFEITNLSRDRENLAPCSPKAVEKMKTEWKSLKVEGLFDPEDKVRGEYVVCSVLKSELENPLPTIKVSRKKLNKPTKVSKNELVQNIPEPIQKKEPETVPKAQPEEVKVVDFLPEIIQDGIQVEVLEEWTLFDASDVVTLQQHKLKKNSYDLVVCKHHDMLWFFLKDEYRNRKLLGKPVASWRLPGEKRFTFSSNVT